MRKLIVALALIAAACSPASTEKTAEAPATPGQNGEPQAPDPERDAMVAVINPLASEDIGIPIALQVTTKRVEGDWGWIVGQPWTPEGAQIDWSTTKHASRAEHGAMDSSGAIYALLKRENDQWRVVAITIAPTDVAFADWPQRYGAPASVMDLPPG